MSVRAICGNCRNVMFECSSDFLCSDYTCEECGAINQFDMSKVPTKVVLPQHQEVDQTTCSSHQSISGDAAST